MRVEKNWVVGCIVAAMLALAVSTAVAQTLEIADSGSQPSETADSESQPSETADPESQPSETADSESETANPEPTVFVKEIVVTSTKREANLQDVPQAISAISAQEIDDIGAQSFSGLVEALPGVEYRTEQAGIGSVSIRGISELNSANVPAGGTGSSVGYYLDELPMTMAGIFPDVASFDVARVEVLRGPQGTLYGEGSLAGTIRLVANQPNASAFAAKADLTYSSTDGGDSNKIGNLMLNIPIVKDTLAVRVSGYSNDMGGFIDTLSWVDGSLLKENGNTSKTTGGRASIAWTPNDELAVTATAIFSNASRGTVNRANRSFEHATSVLEFSDDDIAAYNLTVNYAASAFDLVSSTSIFDRDIHRNIDQGPLVTPVNYVLGMVGLSVDGVFTDQVGTSEAFAQEIRLVSNGGGPWQWTVGGFYKKQEYATDFSGETVPEIPQEVTEAISEAIFGFPMSTMLFVGNEGETTQTALFGELSYDISDRWQLLAGARVFEEKRQSRGETDGLFSVLLSGNMPTTVETEAEDTLFNPKLTATCRFSDDAMGYATYSEGFRSGGQNDFYSLVPGAPVTFDPETLGNAEVGVKTAWLDHRLVLNAAVYFMDWKDLQAVTIEGPGGLFEVQDNVGDAHSLGTDIELTYAPINGLLLSVATSLLQAETDEDFTVADQSGGPGVVIPSGSRIPRAAEKSFSAYGLYTFPVSSTLGGMARVSYSYTGDSTVSLTRPDLITPSYGIVNARFGIVAQYWEVSIFADNLTNEFVPLRAGTFAAPFTGDFWTIGRPRSYGANVRLIF